MQANRLHMEAALLSNTLHEFQDDDIDGVRPVMQKIASIRAEWQSVVNKLEFFNKTGSLPTEKTKPSIFAPAENAPGAAELRIELSKLNVNISKYAKKIETQPDHKKVEQWREDLAKMEALKIELKQSIVNLNYETAQ